jgi:predicted metal-dependent hydrolase
LTVFARGVDHFNALEFWEAHEAWEELWLEADGDLVEFYQGLIQLAAAYHHMKRGTFRGAVRLFDAALRRLEPFADGFHHLDRAAAVKSAREHRAFAERGESLHPDEYPKLQFTHPN